jgi:protein-S-isoprenylcysteine O-methyltransferase Ste14
MNEKEKGRSLGKQALALVVLVIAGFIVLKVVINIVAGLAGVIVLVLALVAVLWAWRTL